MASSKAINSSIFIATLIVIVAAAVDFCTVRINTPILYSIPLVAIAKARRGAIWPVALVLILLTYGGYFFGPWPETAHGNWAEMFYSNRVINRTSDALVLFAVAAMSSVTTMIRRSALARAEARFEPGEEVFLALDRLIAAVICPLLIVLVAVTDLFTPAFYNLTIFYTVPLLFCPWTGSRRYLWGVTFLTTLVAVFGFVVNVHGDGGLAIVHNPVNRIMAISALPILASLLHFWMGEEGEDFAIEPELA